MKKEIFRQFERSLLVYRAGENAPASTSDDEDSNVKIENEYREDDKFVDVDFGADQPDDTTEQFAGKRLKAMHRIKEVNLDNVKNIDSHAEKQLKTRLVASAKKQFDQLEADYDRIIDTIGEVDLSDPEAREKGQKLKEAEVKLKKAADQFIKNLEFRILQEGLEKASVGALGQIIDDFIAKEILSNPKEGEEPNKDLKGLGRFIAKGNLSELRKMFTESKPESVDEIHNKLKALLNNKDVIQNGIDAMRKELPNFRATKEEKDYLTKMIKDSAGDGDNRLHRFFGKGNIDIAASTMANRLHIVFKGPNDPEFIYDNLTKDVYEPGERWENALRTEYCHGDFKYASRISSQYEKVKDRAIKQEADLKEPLENWPEADDDEMGLTVLAENAKLIDNIASTESYLKIANSGMEQSLASIRSMASQPGISEKTGKALDEITQALTPERIRKAQLLPQLNDLLSMISDAINRKNPPTPDIGMLEDIKDALNVSGEESNEAINPVKVHRVASENYKQILAKSPKAQLDQIMKAFLNPKGEDANKLFSVYRARVAEIKAGRINSNQLSEFRNSAGKQAIENHLKKNLNASEIYISLKDDETFALTFRAEKGFRTVNIKNSEGELTITEGDKKTPAPNNLEGLVAAIIEKTEMPAKAVAKNEEKVEDKIETAPLSEVEIYKSALNDLVENQYKKEYSKLGKILRKVKKYKNKGPGFKKMEGKNLNERQENLDKARVAFITDPKRFSEYKKVLDSSPISEFKEAFARRKKESESTIAAVETVK